MAAGAGQGERACRALFPWWVITGREFCTLLALPIGKSSIGDRASFLLVARECRWEPLAWAMEALPIGVQLCKALFMRLA